MESHICDQAVSGCKDLDLKQKLLSRSQLYLTGDIVIHTASSMELCRVQARAMSRAQANKEGRRIIDTQTTDQQRRSNPVWYRCGEPGHFARECYLRDIAKCTKCEKIGHLPKVYQTKAVHNVESASPKIGLETYGMHIPSFTETGVTFLLAPFKVAPFL